MSLLGVVGAEVACWQGEPTLHKALKFNTETPTTVDWSRAVLVHAVLVQIQGYLAHKQTHLPLGPP